MAGRNQNSKSMYSLMLSEDVVAMVDRLAYERNTNRSNMINQILAEYVSYETPEMRLADIFRQLEESLCADGNAFQRLASSSGTILGVRSALAYKYNPTVRYQVELYKGGGAEIGELRVSLRTQNEGLISYLQAYYRLWNALEKPDNPKEVNYRIERDKLFRKLVLHRDPSGHLPAGGVPLGRLIADYVGKFDAGLKFFFDHLDAPALVEREVASLQEEYRSDNECWV